MTKKGLFFPINGYSPPVDPAKVEAEAPMKLLAAAARIPAGGGIRADRMLALKPYPTPALAVGGTVSAAATGLAVAKLPVRVPAGLFRLPKISGWLPPAFGGPGKSPAETPRRFWTVPNGRLEPTGLFRLWKMAGGFPPDFSGSGKTSGGASRRFRTVKKGRAEPPGDFWLPEKAGEAVQAV